jgi:GT2 family glycosyltransferase
MTQKNSFISVVVCAFSLERFDKTIDCINSVLNNTYKNFEIILVIDGNQQLKQKMDLEFRYCKNFLIIDNKKNEGPAISRNKGVEYTKGDIVAFIDDDAFADPYWLENIVKDFLQYPEILCIGGKLLPVYENGSKRLPEEILWLVGGTYKGHPESKQVVRNVFTGNMAVRRDIFMDIKFKTMIDNKKNSLSHQLEDTLFCVMLNKIKPDTVLYDPEIIVYHHVPNDRLKIRYIAKRSYDEGKLKAKLENINRNDDNDKKVLSSEQNYLNSVLISIIKNLSRFNIRSSILILLTVSSVLIGYTKEKYL